jgi:hypothetical protein
MPVRPRIVRRTAPLVRIQSAKSTETGRSAREWTGVKRAAYLGFFDMLPGDSAVAKELLIRGFWVRSPGGPPVNPARLSASWRHLSRMCMCAGGESVNPCAPAGAVSVRQRGLDRLDRLEPSGELLAMQECWPSRRLRSRLANCPSAARPAPATRAASRCAARAVFAGSRSRARASCSRTGSSSPPTLIGHHGRHHPALAQR